MSSDRSLQPPEQYDLSDLGNLHHRQPSLSNNTAYSADSRSIGYESLRDGASNDRPASSLSTDEVQLLSTGHNRTAPPGSGLTVPSVHRQSQKWNFFLHCLLHLVPLAATIVIFTISATEFYWQDLGRPDQNIILQALQYAAKAHEVAIAASLTAIVVHRTQLDLSGSSGVPLGILIACFQLSEPLSVFRTDFRRGVAARIRPQSHLRFLLHHTYSSLVSH